MPAFRIVNAYLSLVIATTGYASLDREIVLEFQPGSQVLNQLSISTGGSDQDTTYVSGTQTASVRFDENSLEPLNFTFTGSGRAFRSDLNMSVSSLIQFSDRGTVIGTFPTIIGLSTRENSYISYSNLSTADVVPGTGALDNDQHHDYYDRGTATVSITVAGETFSEVVQFQFNPNIVEMEGTNIVKIERVPSNSPLDQRLKVSLTSSFIANSSDLFVDTNARMTTVEEGDLLSVGYTTIPTPYSHWLANNSVFSESGYEQNRFGISYYLLYVLDLPISSKKLPIGFEKSDPNSLSVILPSAGLKEDLIIEYSNSLIPDSWIPIDSSFFVDTGASLNKGASGKVRIRSPHVGTSFFRIVADPTKQTSTFLSQ